MDLSTTTAPDSTQVNAEDFLAGPRMVTITGVRGGTDEQPVNIDLAEYPGRSYRPGKSMRRVLVAAWGADSAAYIGRRLTLFNDPNISFGRERTGGIRIQAMSDIPKPMTLALTVSRGKRAPFTVQPLADAPAPSKTVALAAALTIEEFIEDAQTADDDAQLNVIARKAVAALSGADLDAVKAVVTARRADLKEAAPAEPTLDWPAVPEVKS